IKGHLGSIEAITITNDGKKIVSGSTDGTIKIWNFKNGRLEATLQDIGSIIMNLIITPDDEYIISNSQDKIKIWNLETYDLIFTLSGQKGIINSFDITSDGKFLIAGTNSGNIIIWDLINKTIINESQLDFEIEEIKTIPIKSSNELITFKFLYLDNEGNIYEWIKLDENIKDKFEIFQKLDLDEINKLVSNLVYSKISLSKLESLYKISRDEIDKFITFLEENDIINGFYDKNNNYLSYISVENSIKEILNLSGTMKLTDINNSIGLENKNSILKIIQNMINENKIKGYYNEDKDIFITYEELLSNVAYKIKEKKIIRIDEIENIFNVDKNIILNIVNELVKRRDISNVEISDSQIKLIEVEKEKEVLDKPIEIIEEIPEEIPEEILEEIPEEALKEDMTITHKQASSDITKGAVCQLSDTDSEKFILGRKEKSKIDDYIDAIYIILQKFIKIFEILEIPAFYDEIPPICQEIINLNECSLQKFKNDDIDSRISELNKKIDEIYDNKEKIKPILYHDLEFELLKFIREFLKEKSQQLKSFVEQINEPMLFKILNDSFNKFDQICINQDKYYTENILDSIIILDKDLKNTLFQYRFRPSYYDKIIEDALEIIKNEDGKLIHEDYQIKEYQSNNIFVYSKEIDNAIVIMITTGKFIPIHFQYFNECAANIKITKEGFSDNDLEKLRKFIVSKFDFKSEK
ncbi:MAG: WD40 repeat domain-containing protein, partial [Candidatus Helarchaeota archaeon]